MTEDQARNEVVSYRRKQTREALDSARSELSANRLAFAMNRAYYACFYAASAVLLMENRRFVKHSGLRAAIHRHLVKPGRIDKKWGKVFDRLFESRQEADYHEIIQLSRDDVTDAIQDAEAFVSELEKLLP